MKSRSTLTLESTLLHQIEAVAHAQGIAISKVVNSFFSDVESPEKKKEATPISFSARWLGKFKLDEKKEPQFRYLKKKYDL
ncbi:MAG: DUF6364 family protein [Chthoniobacterales bacterium]